MRLSATGRRWVLEETDPGLVERLVSGHGMEPIVAGCLAPSLGGREPGTWLEPSLEHLHSPSLMLGMDAAVDRLSKAVRDRERIRIVTDYDVDGTTSSLILQAMCRMLGAGDLVDYHIPDRFGEGYGFSVLAAERAASEGVGLVLTADIGVRDHASVSAARAGGADVIICDHHLPPGESVPGDASAVLCPPQEGCTYPNRHLAACGVSLKFAQAMLADHSALGTRWDAVLRSMLKIAAIGTVADMVSLGDPENRAIVTLGLRELCSSKHTPGLQALLDVCGLQDGWIDAGKIGFDIAPRINAAGRLHLATDVIELFQCRDRQEARRLAKRLDDFNLERREIQRGLVERALQQVPDPLPYFAVVRGREDDGWHRGVVGIVASKLKESISRSAAVLSIDGEFARGSIRTMPAVHAVHALDSVQDLLRNYGGHAAAAGFDVPSDRIGELAARLDTYARENVGREELVPELRLRVACSPSDLGMSTVSRICSLGPFGMGNPAPVLWVKGAVPQNVRVLKERHLKFQVGGIDALWWNSAEHRSLLESGAIDLAARVEINRWRQRSRPQYVVQDVRQA
jgi:single-stranded-DNA-specific exonuclease